MSGRVSWVLSPTGGKAHLLAVEVPGGAMLATQCGYSLPSGVIQHDRVPSRQLCRECFAVYLLPPDSVFARKAPAGCRLNDAPASVPGGQPVPALPAAEVTLPDHGHPVAGDLPGALVPRWARCPVDQQLHLLAPVEAAAAGFGGHGRAGCGRRIPAAGLTIEGPAAGFCVGCVAVGTA